MEYNYAVEKDIPVLVFCLDENINLPEDKYENDLEKQKKLSTFKEKAMKNRLASIWKDITELSGQVAISIMSAKNEIDRPGWIRANNIGNYNGTELLSQINELRIENRELSKKLKDTESRLFSQDNLEHSDIAFENTQINIKVHNLNGNKSKSSNLRELFGLIALEMLQGFTSISNIESTLCKFAGGSTRYHLDNPSLARILVNQYRALGLINIGPAGLSLTELGKKVQNDINLIKK